MKYLCILLDENLIWSHQISHIQMKLNQPSNWSTQEANVPSKHSYTQNSYIHHSYIRIPFSIWNSSSLCLLVMGSKQQGNTKSILNSPKQSTQVIVFRNRYESADHLYKKSKNNQVSRPSLIKQLLAYGST